jgi:hypothetical protein
MAATSKPARKKIKHVAKVMRNFTKHGGGLKAERKSMEKPSLDAHKRFHKEIKHSKEDLQKANAHMKKHGG